MRWHLGSTPAGDERRQKSQEPGRGEEELCFSDFRRKDVEDLEEGARIGGTTQTEMGRSATVAGRWELTLRRSAREGTLGGKSGRKGGQPQKWWEGGRAWIIN